MYVCSTSKAKVASRIIIRQYCLQWGNQKVDFGWKMLVTPLQHCFATQKTEKNTVLLFRQKKAELFIHIFIYL